MVHTTPAVRRIGLLALIATLVLAGCRGERETPEGQVRATIQGAVTAAERKDLGTLRDLISARYTDDQGQNKQAVENLLRLHFLRNESVYLYARIQSVMLPQPDQARAAVLVAMAGVPIASEADLPALRADLHRFDVELGHEGKVWRVQRASWRRAEPGEFLGP